MGFPVPLVDDAGLDAEFGVPPQPVALVDDAGLDAEFGVPGQQPGALSQLGSGLAAGVGGLATALANPYAMGQAAFEQPRQSAAMAARIGGPMLGAMAGGLAGPVGAGLGGAAGGYIGEDIAGRITGQPSSMADKVIGAAGGAFIPGNVAGGLLKTALVRGGQGAAFGAADEAARTWWRGDEQSLERIGAATGIGGTLGAALGVPEGIGNRRLADKLRTNPEQPNAKSLVDDAGLDAEFGIPELDDLVAGGSGVFPPAGYEPPPPPPPGGSPQPPTQPGGGPQPLGQAPMDLRPRQPGQPPGQVNPPPPRADSPPPPPTQPTTLAGLAQQLADARAAERQATIDAFENQQRAAESPAEIRARKKWEAEQSAQQQPEAAPAQVPDSALSAFPDMPVNDEGGIGLNGFTLDEQDALRAAGLVRKYQTADGYAYEGADAQGLWRLRDEAIARIKAARQSATSPPQAPQAPAADPQRRTLTQIFEERGVPRNRADRPPRYGQPLPRTLTQMFEQQGVSRNRADRPPPEAPAPAAAETAPLRRPGVQGAEDLADGRRLHDLTLAELEIEHQRALADDEAALAEVFPGRDLADIKRRLRKSDPALEDELGGPGDPRWDRIFGDAAAMDPKTIRQYINDLHWIEDAETPRELGERLAGAMVQLGRADVSRVDTLPFDQRRHYAKLRHAHEVIQQRGWSTKEVSNAALSGAAGQIGDPQDIEFMLGRFLRQPAPGGQAAKVLPPPPRTLTDVFPGTQAKAGQPAEPAAAPKPGEPGWIDTPEGKAWLAKQPRGRREQERANAAREARKRAAAETAPPPAAKPPPPPSAPASNITRAFGPTGNRYEFRYRVVELDDIIFNHPDVQSRNRGRGASDDQVQRLARRWNVEEYLAGADTLDKGAMIVGADLKAESGNGRGLALRLIRDDPGYGGPERLAGLGDDFRKEADRLGLSEQDFAGKREPVVVRERLTEVADRKEFADEANARAGLGMAPAENAVLDARRLPPGAIAAFKIGDTQTVEQALNSPVNRDAMIGFLSGIPENDRGTLLTADMDRLSVAGLQRLKAALLANIYEGESGRRLVDALTESADTGIKKVEAGIFASLGKMARAKQLVRDGLREGSGLDLTDDIAIAAQKLAQLRSEGASVEGYLKQEQFLARELTPTQELLLEALDRYGGNKGGSGARVRTFINSLADQVVDAPTQEAFPGMQDTVTPAKMVARAHTEVGGPDLFGALKNERGSVTVGGPKPRRLRDIYAAAKAREDFRRATSTSQATAEAEARLRAIRRTPSLNKRALEGQPSGSAPPPVRGPVESVDAYGNPIKRRGALSSRNRDALSPSHTQHNEPFVADLQNVVANAEADLFDYARRGRVPVKESLRRGQELVESSRQVAARWDMTEAELAATFRKRGETLNAEGMAALASQANEEISKVGLVAARGAGPEELRAAMVGPLMLELQSVGAASELGRALNILKYVNGTPQVLRRALQIALRQNLPKDRMALVREALAGMDPTDPLAMNQFIRNVVIPATASDKGLEVWINWGLLSGLRTLVANGAGNTLMVLERPATRLAAAGIEALRGGPRERFAGEAIADMVGLVHGVRDGLTRGWQALKTEMPSEAGSKVLEYRGGRVMGAIKGKVAGRIARAPGSLLLATDEFFKAVAGQGELYAQAYRIARREGKTGRKAGERMADIIGAPSQIEGLLDAVASEARYRTFTDDLTKANVHGRIGLAVKAFRDAHPAMAVLLPFVRTPIKIAYAGAWERTPVALADVLVRGLKGTLGESRGQVADEIARAMLGTALAVGVASLVLEGKITGGGPRDPTKRAAWRADHLPYSVNIGGKWYSYARLEPFATAIGLTADGATIAQMDVADPYDYATKAAKAFAISLGYNLSNKTFLRGISDLMLAISDPERYGDSYFEGLAGTLVPNLAAQAARAADPVVRRPRGLAEVFQARIPGDSDKLLPMRDMWGQPITRYGLFDGSQPLAGFIERLTTPVEVQDIPNDPATREVSRLGIAPAAINLTMRIRGTDRELTFAQVDRLTELRGGMAKKEIDRLIQTPRYRTATEERQVDALRNAFRRAGAKARQQFRAELTKAGLTLPLKPKPSRRD